MLYATSTPTLTLRHNYLAQKLNFLLDVLRESKRGYEKFASDAEDKNMRGAVNGLAQECNQYITELCSQIKSLGAEEKVENDTDVYIWNYVGNSTNPCADDVIRACSKSEGIVVKAYREVLNDPTLLSNLRTMIKYQLNGMLYAFVKVKLLNSAMKH